MTAVLLGTALVAYVPPAVPPASAATWPVLSAGVSHTCALMPSAQVECWGYNSYGELGNGTNTNSTTPVQVATLPPAQQISAGEFVTCAIDVSSTAWCWGSNHYGALGNAKTVDKNKPVQVAAGQMQFSTISTGGVEFNVSGSGVPGAFTCGVLKGRGDVYCWGNDSNGELGNGTATNIPNTSPILVSGLPGPASQVAAGGLHACALLLSGAVWCWGLNNHGQLGDNKTKQSDSPVQVIGVGGATAVGAGTYDSCALLGNGSMLCWGDNANGELGNGSTTDSPIPVPVTSLAGTVTQIAVDGYHTCALENGSQTEVECWGDDQDGALGDGHFNEPPVTTPEPVFGVAGSPASGAGVLPEDVAAGQDHTCASIDTGQVFCWGNNAKGQLGEGTQERRAVPTMVLGLAAGVQQVASGSDAGCAVDTGLTLKCWGAGDGNDFTLHDTAQAVATFSGNVATVSTGDEHVCGLSTAGALQCWGANGYGQLGNGTTTPSATPVAVTGLPATAGAIAEGSFISCASLAKLRTLWCWGDDDKGQLGDGTTNNNPNEKPQEVTTTLGVQLSTADEHACTISTNGRAYCWGANDYGELGNYSTSQSSNPVQVVGLPATPVQIAAGGYTDVSGSPNDFSCALVTTGDVYCWGINVYGQLGDGSSAQNSLLPVKVGLSGPAKEVVAGSASACALLMTGSIQCWGNDASGQLGDGGSGQQLSPVSVSALSQVIQISETGVDDSACALTASGAAYCWGDNTNDELGDGSSGGSSNTPQAVQGL